MPAPAATSDGADPAVARLGVRVSENSERSKCHLVLPFRRDGSTTGHLGGGNGGLGGGHAATSFSPATWARAEANTAGSWAPDTPYLPSRTKNGTPWMPYAAAWAWSARTAPR